MSDIRDFINENIDPILKIGIVMGGYLDEKDHLMSREELHDRIFNTQLALVTANKIIEILEKSNDFYVNYSSWGCDPNNEYFHDIIAYEDSEKIEGYFNIEGKIGGKTARQAKLEVGKLRGDK